MTLSVVYLQIVYSTRKLCNKKLGQQKYISTRIMFAATPKTVCTKREYKDALSHRRPGEG